jgi:hypothetical protein
MTSHMHQKVAFLGAYEALLTLDKLTAATAVPLDVVESELLGIEVPDTIHELSSAGLVRVAGENINLTTLGVRTVTLLEALNGGDLWSAYRRLARADPGLRRYELVRQGMTKVFLRSLIDRPGVGRLYICSPWISLDADEKRMLAQGVSYAKPPLEPEILVITRPALSEPGLPPSAQVFLDLGGTVFLHPRLHTKLYIREPDISGGFSMAIIGSQNLTGSKYLELGIRINGDTELIGQLVRYFIDLTNVSKEYPWEGVT